MGLKPSAADFLCILDEDNQGFKDVWEFDKWYFMVF